MITVFTPTYNRKYIIDKLYQSLLKQTSFDFEWLVVDDGSTDDTKGYFDTLLAKENPFPIRYFYKENGGKHKAINYGVQNAQGEAFFIVDSDDSLTPNAVEKISVWLGQVRDEKQCAGVAGTRGYTIEKRIGSYYNDSVEYINATNLEREKYNLLGDKAEVYFTKVLREYPFPEFDGERFLTEEVVWNKIAMDGLFLRWYPDIVYLGDYLNDGLTKSGDKKYQDNPKGTLYWSKQQLEIYKKGFTKRTLAINRYYKAVKGKKSVREMARELGVSACRCRIAIFAVKVGKLLKKGV